MATFDRRQVLEDQMEKGKLAIQHHEKKIQNLIKNRKSTLDERVDNKIKELNDEGIVSHGTGRVKIRIELSGTHSKNAGDRKEGGDNNQSEGMQKKKVKGQNRDKKKPQGRDHQKSSDSEEQQQLKKKKSKKDSELVEKRNTKNYLEDNQQFKNQKQKKKNKVAEQTLVSNNEKKVSINKKQEKLTKVPQKQSLVVQNKINQSFTSFSNPTTKAQNNLFTSSALGQKSTTDSKAIFGSESTTKSTSNPFLNSAFGQISTTDSKAAFSSESTTKPQNSLFPNTTFGQKYAEDSKAFFGPESTKNSLFANQKSSKDSSSSIFGSFSKQSTLDHNLNAKTTKETSSGLFTGQNMQKLFVLTPLGSTSQKDKHNLAIGCEIQSK